MSSEIPGGEDNSEHYVSKEEIEIVLKYHGLDPIKSTRQKDILHPLLVVNRALYASKYLKQSLHAPPELSPEGKEIGIDELTMIALHRKELTCVLDTSMQEGNEYTINTKEKNVLKERRGKLGKILQLSSKRIVDIVDPEIIIEIVDEQQISLESRIEREMRKVSAIDMEEYRRSLIAQINKPHLFSKYGIPHLGADLAEYMLVQNHEIDMRKTAESADKWLRERTDNVE